MFFETDNQTSQDLEFFNSNRLTKSVFDVYSRTVTKGGQEVMRKLFKTPVTDPELLQCRRAEI
jgi:DNA mismatch repair ATPase MutS